MFCPNCRKELSDDANFCIKCGYDMSKIRDLSEDTSSSSEGSIDKMATIQSDDEKTFSGEGTIKEDKDESLGDGKTIEAHAPVIHDGTKYEIISTIGEGGMGKVYKARDNTLNRIIALKRLSTQLSGSQQAIDRFLNEARSIALLNNSNIVQVYGFGEDRDGYFIAMEYVDGVNLKEYIEEKGKLAAEEATKIILNVAKGLSAAHEQEITHRDIKPANILWHTQINRLWSCSYYNYRRYDNDGCYDGYPGLLFS
jgi:tRNA A-37 threonylcarbamoyl transferase component Bud32